MLLSGVRRSLLSLILVGALLVAPGSMAAATAGDMATLTVLAGSVTVSGAAGPMPATDGQTVHAGDEIWTGPDGVALLTFFDASETQLQSDTHITLELPDGGNGVSVFQSAGTTVNHVHHLAPNASFQTDTPTAVAMVRGTTYVVTATPASDASSESDTADPAAQMTADTPVATDASSTADAPPADASPAPDVTSRHPPAPDDQADQQAALIASMPLFDPALASAPDSCDRANPSSCTTSIVLLADIDGHVGHVEVASHIVGHPTLHLTAHGDAANVSHAGAVRQVIEPDHLAQLHDAAQHLRDVEKARAANAAIAHYIHRHRGLHHSHPPTPPDPSGPSKPPAPPGAPRPASPPSPPQPRP